MILYHGTTVESAERIKEDGFVPDKKYNWKVNSKKGFVYLSKAYTPFYAMTAKSRKKNRVIIKVNVDEKKLYPDDDFVMLAIFNKKVFTQKELDKVILIRYKYLVKPSLRFMGNCCAKSKDIKILGMTEFDASGLIMVCDPAISPTNYKIMGHYYEKLTEWIYEGKNPTDFRMNAFESIKNMKW